MTELNCEFKPPEKALTVGTLFDVVCVGDMKNAKPENLALTIAQKDKYVFVVKDVQLKDSTTLVFRATSYLAGSHEVKDLELMSGEEKYQLSPFKFKVESVLSSQEQKPEPFGPFGPLDLLLPFWFWASSAGAVLVFVFSVVFLLIKRLRMRRLFAKIKDYENAQAPFVQLSKDLRVWQRRWEQSPEDGLQGLQELERFLRVYLTRKFQIPAFEWKFSRLLKDLKKQGVDESTLKKIRLLFSEIEKAKRAKVISKEDVNQLLQLEQKLADHLESFKTKELRK